MTAGQVIAYVIIPLVIFVIGALGTGIIGIVKLTVYFAHTREAQESTAKSTEAMAKDLKGFIGETNNRLNDHGERISVLENVTGVGK